MKRNEGEKSGLGAYRIDQQKKRNNLIATYKGNG